MQRDQTQKLQILSGKKTAFREFYTDTRTELRRFIQMKINIATDAEEVLQDTYLSFLDSLPLYRGEASLKTFLYAIARHEVADYWRKRYAKKAIKTVPFVNQVYTERLFSAAELSSVIDQVYSKLSRSEVRLIKLKYERGLSVEEIATTLQISMKAAESRLFRARKAFQMAYAEMRQ